MFEHLSPALQPVAEAGLKYFKGQLGRTGLKVDQPLADIVPWRPTFYLNDGRHHIVAVEVDQVLYPQILRIAASEIPHYEKPVSAYVVVPIHVYLSDQTSVKHLERDGLGLIVVDDSGVATRKLTCIPLVQHILPSKVEQGLRPLSPRLQVLFRKASTVYRTDAGQGLQDAGQIVERLLLSFAEQAKSKGLASTDLKRPAATIVDDLYQALPHQRAALGACRNFLKRYRNPVSHPPRSAKEARAKLQRCHEGFVGALETARDLRDAASSLGVRLSVSGL
jgi:hypothetical protein